MFARSVRRVPDGEILRSSCNVRNVTFGTGASIYTADILPALEKAEYEVILVTCYWAKSSTRDALSASLRALSRAALQRQSKVRVRICFSASSLLQQLFHTSAPSGHTYHASGWSKKLGLGHPGEYPGLDLEIKSIFFRPFSVMHPKFVIIDQTHVFLPSCNVSWEDWFEGCMLLDGPIVSHFHRFWQTFWANPGDRSSGPAASSTRSNDPSGDPPRSAGATGCVFLPSPHTVHPRFRFPWQPYAAPPQTPLNVFLLSAFEAAKTEIFIQTPNVTSPPVLDALHRALQRGVRVRITTSERLMILEQLVTAGSTTARCIKLLLKRYKGLSQRGKRDEELGLVPPGQLRISYYQPRPMHKRSGVEPVQSHVKLTIIDDEIVIFGSGNMDRASWYTSQELGVAFDSGDLAGQIKESLTSAMQDRTKLVYTSVAIEQD